MKFSRIILLASLTIITGILCSCSNSKTVEISDEIAATPIIPDTEVTLETLVEGTEELCKAVQESYSIMLELASAEDASEKGIKAAKEVEEKYGERIKEISELDFSALSKDELEDYMYEFSNLITAIREARDALTL